jgi:hypothetical protein
LFIPLEEEDAGQLDDYNQHLERKKQHAKSMVEAAAISEGEHW